MRNMILLALALAALILTSGLLTSVYMMILPLMEVLK